MNTKNIFITIILLSLVIITSVLTLLTAKKLTSTHINNTNNPDFFMNNVSYIKFDQKGNIINQFSTSKITHFATNNSYFFDNPRIKMYSANEQPWDITANKGKSEYGKSRIDLWDNVQVMQAASANNQDFNITTTALTFYPDTRCAETKEPITVIQNGSIAKAIGAQADFKVDTVKLLSDIDVQYQAK